MRPTRVSWLGIHSATTIEQAPPSSRTPKRTALPNPAIIVSDQYVRLTSTGSVFTGPVGFICSVRNPLR